MSSNLWSQTPLLHSSKLSLITGASVYLKLENLHPSYSFKYRGISHFIQSAREIHGPSVHLVAASGGNAGVAAACSAQSLGLKCTIFIPEGVAASTLELLKRENAEVVVGGRFYAEALEAAKTMVSCEAHAVMVPAYDDPLIWEGHGSMISEIRDQLPVKPDAIFCSVGGGGLLGGIIVGCRNAGWDDVTIGTVETNGSDCFYESLALNSNRFNSRDKKLAAGVILISDPEQDVCLARLSTFTSKASGSLGASEPSARVLKMALQRQGKIVMCLVPWDYFDRAQTKTTDDHKFLVELACATALAPVYNPPLFHKIMDNARRMNDNEAPVVVFIVCGGFKIDLATALEYKKDIAAFRETQGELLVKYDDGELLSIPLHDRS